MTDEWIDDVTQRMIDLNTSQAVKELATLIRNNKTKITKVVTGIDKTKNEILILALK